MHTLCPTLEKMLISLFWSVLNSAKPTVTDTEQGLSMDWFRWKHSKDSLLYSQKWKRGWTFTKQFNTFQSPSSCINAKNDLFLENGYRKFCSINPTRVQKSQSPGSCRNKGRKQESRSCILLKSALNSEQGWAKAEVRGTGTKQFQGQFVLQIWRDGLTKNLSLGKLYGDGPQNLPLSTRDFRCFRWGRLPSVVSRRQSLLLSRRNSTWTTSPCCSLNSWRKRRQPSG